MTLKIKDLTPFVIPLVGVAAATVPSLLAYTVSPSPTVLNQTLAFALWGLFVLVSRPAAPGAGLGLGGWGLGAALGALGVLGAAAAASWGLGTLPAGLALSALGTLAAAAVLMSAGAGAGARPGEREQPDAFAVFCWAWVAAGVANAAVALVQVFAPEWADGHWLAGSSSVGRAVGNLRQPNHLASLLLWQVIAVVALLELGRLRRGAAAALLALGVLAVVLTASRTGLLSVLVLALWAGLDRRLSRSARALLLAAPGVYLLSWLGMAQWAEWTQQPFGGAQRLAETDISSSRFAIWRDTWTLITQQPWTGVGFGRFNLAWTLTPLPQRPVAFFDHAHNLPLHLLAELGLPLGAAVLALLVAALGQAARRAWQTPGEHGSARRCAVLMVVMIGLHSLLEYPLWYSYFLLPAAWAWGYVLHAAPAPGTEPAADTAVAALRASRLTQLAAALVMVGAAVAAADYRRVALIFQSHPGEAPLAERIAQGQRSLFFAHHADYAAVTTGVNAADPARAYERVVHYLLDTRLMMAWAQSLHAQGQTDAARHLAARLREFRKAESADFFAACDTPAPPPFPCQPPSQPLPWRALLPP